MFQEKIRLKETIEIVGDPHAKESDWLPVCIAAGEKQLVRIKPEPAKRSRQRILLENTVCSSSIVSASVGHFLLCVFTAGFIFSLLTGFGTNWFMEQFKLEQYLAVPVLLFGGIGFWQQFASGGSKLLYLSTAGILFGSCAFFCFAPGPLCLMLALGAVGHSILSAIGLQTRRALPETFKAPAALRAHGISCGLLAGFMLMATFFAVQNSTTGTYQSQPYLDTSAAIVLVMQLMIALGVGVPSAAVAYISKSRSAFSCAWLSVLMQAPVISALALVLILSGVFTVAAGNDLSFVMKILDYFDMPAFSTDVVHTGAAVCLSLLASITSVVMWALVGSKIGVVLNHRFGRD